MSLVVKFSSSKKSTNYLTNEIKGFLKKKIIPFIEDNGEKDILADRISTFLKREIKIPNT